MATTSDSADSSATGSFATEAETILTPYQIYLSEVSPDPRDIAGPYEEDLVHQTVIEFYEARNHQPAWIKDGKLQPNAQDLLDTLPYAPTEGLRTEDYRPEDLAKLLDAFRASRPTETDIMAMDYALSQTYFVVAAHMTRGRVDTSSVRLPWYSTPRPMPSHEVLHTALNRRRVPQSLGELAPDRKEYQDLKKNLERYRNLAAAGGWVEVPGGPTLRPDKSPDSLRVATMEKRLHQEGFLSAVVGDGVLSESLQEAVKRFQESRGLLVDGQAGRVSIEEMNVSVEDRIQQIEMNMERWRWMPEDFGERHLRVNIPAFKLELWDGGDTPDTTIRVVVGRKKWETPVFSDSMRYVVVNPYWRVPSTVAGKTILTKILEDSTYLASSNFEIFTDWGRDAEKVDPATVDWESISATDFPYKLVQRPGPSNALGSVKFLFPNKFAIYLHDTPSSASFRRWSRSYSHGCVRVEDPMRLAEFAFAADTLMTPEKFAKAVKSRRHRTFTLPEPVPVHLIYFTVEEQDGVVRFYRDIYRVDRDLARAIEKRRPLPKSE